ncbi:MAG: DUF3822 family protein [Prolixibacteraceae bacterium]|jgi:hypothetical protein|nr:DUF3822 family protein [Prolixibacteraceae bacterium]
MYATPFIDETFDIYNCHNYILSIQCALDGFSFSILDTTVNKFIVLSEYDINELTPFGLKNKLSSIIDEEPILQRKFKKVKVVYLTLQTTIVPISLYSEDEKEYFFDLQFERDRSDTILSSKVNNQTIILSSIPSIIEKWFGENFNNCTFYSSFSPICSYATKIVSCQKKLLTFTHKHTLFIIALETGNIEFINTFFVKNESDSLYYILNALKQLKASSKTSIIQLGKIDQKSSLTASLSNYIENVNFASFLHSYAVSYTFMQEPEHFHLYCLELALCE